MPRPWLALTPVALLTVVFGAASAPLPGCCAATCGPHASVDVQITGLDAQSDVEIDMTVNHAISESAHVQGGMCTRSNGGWCGDAAKGPVTVGVELPDAFDEDTQVEGRVKWVHPSPERECVLESPARDV